MKKGVLLAILGLCIVMFTACSQQVTPRIITQADQSIQPQQQQQTTADPTQEVLDPQNHIIKITDQGLSPIQLTIKEGDSVTWQSEAIETVVHNIVFYNEDEAITENSGKLYYGDSYSYKFTEKGVYQFFDAANEEQQREENRGSITVT